MTVFISNRPNKLYEGKTSRSLQQTFPMERFGRSIVKAKPRAPEPDRIYNSLVAYLPEGKLKIAKEILYLPRETNTGATKEITTLNQSCWGCDHPTSNWPYQGH